MTEPTSARDIRDVAERRYSENTFDTEAATCDVVAVEARVCSVRT